MMYIICLLIGLVCKNDLHVELIYSSMYIEIKKLRGIFIREMFSKCYFVFTYQEAYSSTYIIFSLFYDFSCPPKYHKINLIGK